MFDYLKFKKVWFLSPLIQIILITLLYLIQTYTANISFHKTGLVFGYPYFSYITVIVAPIYEEIIFRGFIFHTFLSKHKPVAAIIFSSIFFGIWHFKNVFFLSQFLLIKQILYTGLIFGPVMAFSTYKTKSIWPGVILHYLNNIISFMFI